MTLKTLTANDDVYAAQATFEQVDGDAGVDTLTFDMSTAHLNGYANADGTFTILIDGIEATQISSIERVTFSDASYITAGDNVWHVEWSNYTAPTTAPIDNGTSNPGTPLADGYMPLSPGDDAYTVQSYGEMIDGLEGNDTVKVDLSAALITGLSFADGVSILSLEGTEALALRNIERIQFSDASYVTDGQGNWHVEGSVSPPTDTGNTEPVGTIGNDGFLALSAGDDAYAIQAMGEMIDGLAGTDTVSIDFSASHLTGLSFANGVSTILIDGAEAFALRNVERIAFSDVSYITDGAGNWQVETSAVTPQPVAQTPVPVALTDADDVYANTSALEYVDGGVGTDTVTFDMSMGYLNGHGNADGSFTILISGQQDMVVQNVERVTFTDASFVKDSAGNWVVEWSNYTGSIATSAIATTATSAAPSVVGSNELVQNDTANAAETLAGSDDVAVIDVFAVNAASTGYNFLGDAVSGALYVQSPEGFVDTLTNFETIRFADTDLPITSDLFI